jgi:transcriptional regulator with XRE-family HTH domain
MRGDNVQVKLKNQREFKCIIAKKGFSQRGFAKEIKMSYEYLNQIANGRLSPSGKAAKKITDALGLEFDDIFFIANDDKSNQ